MKTQNASAVLMVKPLDFQFNEETAKDNEFQNKLELSASTLKTKVIKEFESVVRGLSNFGIDVLVYEKEENLPELPDSVFPNNWIQFREKGQVILFPMYAKNRQNELLQFEGIKSLLTTKGYSITTFIEWHKGKETALEGTGSLIFDHPSSKVFVAESVRSDKKLVELFCSEFGYEPIIFNTTSSSGKPFYHTNVVLSIGENWAVIGSECIKDSTEKERVISELKNLGKEIIEIDRKQSEKNFCANILELKNQVGEKAIAMSENAFQGFSTSQKEQLSSFGKLLPFPIPTIEQIGGGSVRCMLAEIF